MPVAYFIRAFTFSFNTLAFFLAFSDPSFAQMQRMGVVQQTVIVGGGGSGSEPLQAYCLDETRSAPSGAMSILPGAGLGKVTRLSDGQTLDLSSAMEAGWVAIEGTLSASNLNFRSVDGQAYRFEVDETFAMTPREQMATESTEGLESTLLWLQSKGPKPTLSIDDVWDYRTFTEHGLDPELASAFGHRHTVVYKKDTIAEQAAQGKTGIFAFAQGDDDASREVLLMSGDGKISVFEGPNAEHDAMSFAGRQGNGTIDLIVSDPFKLEQAKHVKSTLDRLLVARQTEFDQHAEALRIRYDAATSDEIREEISAEYRERLNALDEQSRNLVSRASEHIWGTVESGLTLAAQAADSGVDAVRLLDTALEPLAGAGGGGARVIVGPNAAAGDYNGGGGFEIPPTNGEPFPVWQGFPIKDPNKSESRVDVQANDGWWSAIMRSASLNRLRSITNAVYGTLRSSVSSGLSREATTQAVAEAVAFDRAVFEDLQGAARSLPANMQAELLLRFNNDQQLNIRVTELGVWVTRFALLEGSWVKQGTPLFRRF